ncbi:ComEC/Rec2 family competence protein [Alteribacillus sp. HJP-4]|uniref:ComEC/Rec2 family competence protein n=1 Tax=Alteribacillus sp. HJP-4 TaxID=2775394 RepID=UPI0035CD0DD6
MNTGKYILLSAIIFFFMLPVASANSTEVPAGLGGFWDPALNEMKVHFIDVGQGDSILIEGPAGETMLIDGGDYEASGKVISYLKENGIESLDWVVATHPHTDHIGGLVDVLKEIEVGRILDSGLAHTTDTYLDYLTIVDKKDINIDIAEEGEFINFSPYTVLQVLNGFEDSDIINESSIVLKLSYGNVDFMLTADATMKNEARMIQQYDVEAEILKVAHHGSRSSTSQEFLDAIQPQIAILSYGENDYGHPTEGVVSRLKGVMADIFSTKESGDITVITNGTNYHVNAVPWSGARKEFT